MLLVNYYQTIIEISILYKVDEFSKEIIIFLYFQSYDLRSMKPYIKLKYLEISYRPRSKVGLDLFEIMEYNF